MQRQQLVTLTVVAVTFALLLLAERLRPLRRTTESKPRRIFRNLTMAGLSAAIVSVLQIPILLPVSRWAGTHRAGLLNRMSLAHVATLILAVILLDYTLWWWHWANHKLPILWRFHVVHHVDLDLDASTALRFHFGEMALSIGYRALQIVVIGAGPDAVWLWQTILFASILFHHSNVRLPVAVERWLVRLVVTPRMHGIHHSTRESETNTNWSSLLSWWDYVHRTLLLSVPQDDVVIGVPAYHRADDVTVGKILLMPFVRQRDYWQPPAH